MKKLIVMLMVLGLTVPLYAHSGRLDGSGGHRVNKEWSYTGRYLFVKDTVKTLGAGEVVFKEGDYHYHIKPEANGLKDGFYIPVDDKDTVRTDTIYMSDENRISSNKSNLYHHPNCRYIRNIKEENAVIFEDPEDAEESGYEPHKGCNAGRLQ